MFGGTHSFDGGSALLHLLSTSLSDEVYKFGVRECYVTLMLVLEIDRIEKTALQKEMLTRRSHRRFP